MLKILTSECLYGGRVVRYDGGEVPETHPTYLKWKEEGRLIPICPEEIAVAIMAEVIQVKNSSGRNDPWPRELLQAIVDPAGLSVPKALATVVARRGSAPRGAGARMLVWPDGHFLGTIGGGPLEYAAIQAARQRLAAGETAPCLYRASLDADVAANDGMACGGEVTVLIETIEARG